MLQTASFIALRNSAPPWPDVVNVIVTFLAAVLAFVVGILLWRAYGRTNDLQRQLVELEARRDKREREWKCPRPAPVDIVLRREKSTASYAFCLSLYNPGDVPLYPLELTARIRYDNADTAETIRQSLSDWHAAKLGPREIKDVHFTFDGQRLDRIGREEGLDLELLYLSGETGQRESWADLVFLAVLPDAQRGDFHLVPRSQLQAQQDAQKGE